MVLLSIHPFMHSSTKRRSSHPSKLLRASLSYGVWVGSQGDSGWQIRIGWILWTDQLLPKYSERSLRQQQQQQQWQQRHGRTKKLCVRLWEKIHSSLPTERSMNGDDADAFLSAVDQAEAAIRAMATGDQSGLAAAERYGEKSAHFSFCAVAGNKRN